MAEAGQAARALLEAALRLGEHLALARRGEEVLAWASWRGGGVA